MSEALPTLCLVPRDAWVQPDWTDLGYEKKIPRKVHACFTNIYMYENQIPVPIRDWKAAIDEYRLNVEAMQSFEQLKLLMSKLVAERSGLFVYNGTVFHLCKYRRPETQINGNPYIFKYKTCHKELSPEYAASIASNIDSIWGYDPETGHGWPFTLGWFPTNDPITETIKCLYEQWPDSRCQSLLPAGPSPSVGSIELAGICEENGMIGLFGDAFDENPLTAERLRELLGEDAILANVEVDDFWKWSDDLHFDDLSPVDRPLPFQI